MEEIKGPDYAMILMNNRWSMVAHIYSDLLHKQTFTVINPGFVLFSLSKMSSTQSQLEVSHTPSLTQHNLDRS